MALTPAQKKWAVGSSIAAAALAIGYGLFHQRLAHAGLLPAGLSHEDHHHHRGHYRAESHDKSHDEDARENERGEYGHKKHRHHRGHKHD